MAAAILTLRQNRALLKRRKLKDVKDLLNEEFKKTEVEFKQVSPAELFKIKQKIRAEFRQQRKILIFSYVVATVLTLTAILFVFWWLNS